MSAFGTRRQTLARPIWNGAAMPMARDGPAIKDRKGLRARLTQVEAIVQNQDNREHDLLDSDDYYQFEGGAAAAVTSLQGQSDPSTTTTTPGQNAL